jgi:hypothetical protein
LAIVDIVKNIRHLSGDNCVVGWNWSCSKGKIRFSGRASCWILLFGKVGRCISNGIGGVGERVVAGVSLRFGFRVGLVGIKMQCGRLFVGLLVGGRPVELSRYYPIGG